VLYVIGFFFGAIKRFELVLSVLEIGIEKMKHRQLKV
jgi:hypothetical protein